MNGYEGKCSNIHGHTWRVRFSVSGNQLNRFGFVWDFGDFKPMKSFIDEKLDHAMLISQDDAAMIHFCEENKQKHFVLGCNPTSENLAEFLYLVATDRGIPVCAVEIDETCTCSARYQP